MALFKKKLSLAEIIEGINSLTEEEKAELKNQMENGETTEETENAEEVINDTKTNEVAENGEEVTETEEVKEEEIEETPNTEAEAVEEVSANAQSEELNAIEEENKEDINTQLAERVSALEKELAEFKELKEMMQEFTQKQADKFGYKGEIPYGKKDYSQMSTSELSKELRSEI